MIFIKNPEKGKVKTRLAKDVGDEKALKIYRQLLDLTRRATEKFEAEKWLWYSWYIEKNDNWDGDSYHKKNQAEGNLGEKMKFAFEQAFQQGFKKVVIIGSDCPEIEASLINQAYQALDQQDVVLGPANDGGYYLMGMRSYYNFFEGINWSTEAVLDQTIEKIRQKNLSFALLKELTDLDNIQDLKKFDSLC